MLITRKEPFSKVAVRYTPQKKEFEKGFDSSRGVVQRVDYEMVRRGYRRAARLSVNLSEFNAISEKADSNGMVLFPIQLVRKLGPDALVRCVLAKEIGDAIRIQRAMKEGNQMGEIWGYPSCCVGFIDRMMEVGKKPSVYEVALNSEHRMEGDVLVVSGETELNILLGPFGIQFIPWWPCSFSCKKSLETSRNWMGVLEELSPDTFRFFSRVLSEKMAWSLNKGLIFVEHPMFYGVARGEFRLNRVEVRWAPK